MGELVHPTRLPVAALAVATAGLCGGGGLLPMADAGIRPVEQAANNPAQRLITALPAIHAARWAAIRDLTLDDLDLPSRRITIAGRPQRLGELTCRALQPGSATAAPPGRTPRTGRSWSRGRPPSAPGPSARATSPGTCSSTASASSASAATGCSTLESGGSDTGLSRRGSARRLAGRERHRLALGEQSVQAGRTAGR